MSKAMSTGRLRPRGLERPTRVGAVAALVALVALVALPASGAGVAPEDINSTRPPTQYVMPGAVLRVTPSYFDAGSRAQVTFRVAQTRRSLKRATLDLTLPASWRKRTAQGARLASVPVSGTGSSSRVRVRRTQRVVRFSFTNGRRHDTGTYTVTDRALPPATYRARFVLRVDGYEAATGTLSVLVYPVPPQQ